MLRKIKGAWPKFSEELQTEVYAGLLREVAKLHGRTSVVSMISAAINEEKELPSPAKLRGYLPARTEAIWRPTAAQIQEAEEAKQSPEAQLFRERLRRLTGKS